MTDNNDLLARIAMLEAKLAEAQKPKTLSIKVGEKGTVCVYGLGRYPVSLYGTQWQRLIAFAPEVTAFLNKNPVLLTPKDEQKPVQSLADYQAQRQAAGHQV